MCPNSVNCRAEGKIKHCRIKREGRLYTIGTAQFESLVELVEFYMRHPLYKGMKLRYQINEDVSNLSLICFYTFCSATYCNWGHLDKVAKSDYRKITTFTFQESWL